MDSFDAASSRPDANGDSSAAEKLFFSALALAANDRAEFLLKACGDNRGLRQEVEGLLNACEASDGFLESPPLAVDETADAILSQPDRPGKKIGLYRLLEEIGEGGFGTVWVAEQEKPVRRRVALKILKLGMDTKQVVARFEQERQALAMMDHPNIAKVFDAGATASGRPYFAMELVKGSRITEYCDSAELSTADRLRLFAQVCSAVQHAHQKGIIHRDLKPSNVLVTLHDGVAVPKVIDFGVAKATQSERLTDLTIYTQLDQIIGTPVYMAPEQAELSGLDVDTRSDIYSLGVLLYELLTGRPPFDAATLMRAGVDEMRRVIREETPTKPSTLLSTLTKEQRLQAARTRGGAWEHLLAEIRGDLDWIVMKALEKDRRRRYGTAAAFADDITRHLEDRTVSARPPSLGYRSKKFILRNRFAVVSGSAISLALLVGLIGVIWQGVRAQSEEAKANRLLNDLQGTAPAFAEQAQSLVLRSEFNRALEKLEYAIQLRPEIWEYHARKAEILQSQLRLAEAVRAFEDALEIAPQNERVKQNLAITSRFLAKGETSLSTVDLSELLTTMQNEGRSAAELLGIGQRLGKEKDHLLRYWLERLSELPISPDNPLSARLTVGPAGLLEFDLSNSRISDLTPLKGMPLGVLNLTNCGEVTDLSAVSDCPLENLLLDGSGVTDLKPISRCKDLIWLSLIGCGVTDLSPVSTTKLKGIKVSKSRVSDLSPLASASSLEWVEIEQTTVRDLTPLKGKSIRVLMIGQTQVRELSALRSIPLVTFDCSGLPISDFSALGGLPLEGLSLEATGVDDLSFVRGMPLKVLNLAKCPSATGFSTLLEIPQLQELTLPESVCDLPDEEIRAILDLKKSPNLTHVKLGRATWPTANSGTSSLERFWSGVEADIATIAAIKQFVNGFPTYNREPDGSWRISFSGQNVKDLTPLRGKRISRLLLDWTKVDDLEPLRDLPLKALTFRGTTVRDLSPLRGAPLETLDLSRTEVTDLEPLRGMPLQVVDLRQCSVSSLEPLIKSPLVRLYLGSITQELDVGILKQIPTLRELQLPQRPRNLQDLKEHPTLQRLSFDFDNENRRVAQDAAEFWSGKAPETPEELCRRGEYHKAIPLLRRLVRSQGTDGPMLGLACAVAATGDKSALEEAIQELIATYNRSSNASAGIITLLICNLSPEIFVPEEVIDEIAYGASTRTNNGDRIARFRLAEALLNLRIKRYELLHRGLDEITSASSAAPPCGASAIAAMAYHNEGKPEAARAALKRARRLIKAGWPRTAADHERWEYWFCAHLLIQEAEHLLGER